MRRNGGRTRLLAALVVGSIVAAAAALVPGGGSVTGRLLGASGSAARTGPGGTSAVQAAAATSAATAAATACSGLYFVSARGSGQPYGKRGETAAEKAADISVSPQTNAVLTTLKADLPNVPITVHQLSYPAPSVSVLGIGLTWSASAVDSDWDQFMHVNLPEYIGEEQQGEAELSGYLTQIYYDCYPKGQEPMVVLAGYSQGAMVDHNILNELATNPNTGYLSLIKGAVLIADPERMPHSDIKNFGTAPIGDYGVCHTLDEFIIPHEKTGGSCVPPNTTTDVAKALSSQVYQVCDTSDLACDVSGLFRLNSHGLPALTDGANLKQDWKEFKQDYENGKLVHTTHYMSGAVTAAARQVARNLVRDGLGTTSVPSSPSPSPTPTSTGAGTGSWTALAAPEPSGATSGRLESVTCPSTSCVATGWDSNGILIVSGSGSSWTATDTPGPVSTQAGNSIDPEGGPYVACATPGACTAVGYYLDSATGPGSTYSYLVTEGTAGSWTVRKPPLPANALADGDVELRSVACPSTTQCVAVGSYTDSSYTTEGLVLTGSGSSWQATEAPLPTDAATSNGNTELWSVACLSASQCVIGGGYAVAGSGADPAYSAALILTGSGSSWTPSTTPVPANAIADATNLGVASDIEQVTCPASGCVAIGGYMNTSKTYEAMLLTQSGTSWTVTESPLPGGQSATAEGSEFLGFGCISASACTAWGIYDQSTAKPRIMTVTGSGTSWQASNIAAAGSWVSADAQPDVACLSATVCTALDPYDADPGLMITGNGSTWTATTAPLPSDAQSTDANLSALACSSAQCVSVGNYWNSADNEEGLLDIEPSR